MPGRAELAAATDIGDHIGAAPPQPDPAHLRQIDRRLGDLEAAVAVHDRRRRSVGLHHPWPHQEIGDPGSVRGRRPVLLDHVLRGIEAGGQGLDPGDLAAVGVGQPERAGVEETLGGEEQPVGVVVGADQVDIGVGRQGQTATQPDAGLVVIEIDHALDVSQQDDRQLVLRTRNLLHSLARAGLEHHLRPGGGGVALEVREIVGDHRAGVEGLPGGLQAENHLAVHIGLEPRLQRQGYADRPRFGEQAVLALEEGDAAPDHDRVGVSVRAIEHRRRRGDVGGQAAEHLARRAAAGDRLDDVGVARRGDLGRRPGARHGQGVAVDPRAVLLALGEAEAAVDELLRHGVEFAQLHGVATAVRERHQAQGLGGLQAVRALPEPALALGPGERVEVEDRLPDRVLGAVGRLAGVAPDTLHVGGVLP